MKRSGIERRTPMPRPTKPLKRTGRLPFRSVKRAREYVTRRALAAAIEAEGQPTCFVDGCNAPADDLHELLSRARGGSITDPDNCVPVCRPHHNRITTEPAWAEAHGYARSRGPR